MMSKIYTDNLARSNSNSSRGIAGRGVAMQAIGPDLSNLNCHDYIKFGPYKNDCNEFKAVNQQNQRRRRRLHKQRGGHQPHQPKPGGSSSRGGGGGVWYSYYKTTTHNDAHCHARPANGLNGNAHFTRVRLPSVPGICSSWDFPVGDDSDEKPCISISAREVQPATEQTLSFGGPVAEEKSNLCYTFRMANDEEPVEKAVMTSSSVAITSEDSVNSNLATLMAPAEPLAGEVKESLLGGASAPSEGRASPETVRPSPAPVPATATRGAAMRDNRIHRPNVVTRCAAAEVTGAVTRYRGVHPNINNNNHAALAERFQPSTLHKLRRLNIYTNTDTPDTAHQLDAETVPVEVVHTRTNTQPSCSGGGESNRVPNTFKEAVGLPQAAHWKTASDKEMESLEKQGVFSLVLITSVLAGHRVVGTGGCGKLRRTVTI